ncbi:helix-turn-helix transcriptional regulator [Streptomyces sp. NPDC020917]|uniref:helix-turn-helix transcriptional regulator n=1 Tax=Streptomyces sp. NPDC020917 TaxID=3365102 RepID=UPI0037A4FF66
MCHPAYRRALVFAQHLKDLARLRRVRDRIDREYAVPLDVEALAHAAGVTAAHLSRQFRLAYGEAPHAYLLARRVERATVLLHGGAAPADVHRAVGCPSPDAFRTLFTAWAGIPPDAYARRAAPGAARGPAVLPDGGAGPAAGPVRNREAQVPEPQLA